MVDSFPIAAEITNNARLLSCSLLARHLFMVMVLKADDEGRARADPMTWMANAALFGPAAVDSNDIEAAMAELSDRGLAPQYEVEGKRYFFLPGRFEHNRKRSYWAGSKAPLPPVGLWRDSPNTPCR